MARYLSLHTLACLTRQGAGQLAARLQGGLGVAVRRVLVNMTEGKMLVDYEAADRDVITGWFEREKFHHDWLLRVEFEPKEGKLVPVG